VRAVPVLADVGDAAAVEAMVGQALAELGAIDVLVCNAAIRPHRAITETSLDDWQPRCSAVNLHSAFYLARAVVPAMKERRRGSIIAIGGQSSLTGRPNTAAVTAAKTGLLGLVRGARRRAGALRCPRQHGDSRLHGYRAALRRVVSGVSARRPRERRSS